MNKKTVQTMRGSMLNRILVLALTVLLGACYFPATVRDYESGAGAPWWCQGTPDLNQAECLMLSFHFDRVEAYARQYPTVADAIGAGALNVTAFNPAGTGTSYLMPGADPTVFNPNRPQVLLYAHSGSSARLAGVLWSSNSVTAPAGFPGARDVWASIAGGWVLPAWIIRGYQNHPDVFAANHACLAAGVTLGATTDACFLASHTEAFDVLVANDDGVQAPGIDALVEGLYGLPNIQITVVAPAHEQSGSGDSTSAPGSTLTGTATTTLSGRAATAVHTDDPADLLGSGSPADSVLYALLGLPSLSPEVVLSGINSGQNYSTIGSNNSGTVGAARTARRNGVPAIATSQGSLVAPWDFPSGVAATLALLEEWRLGLRPNRPQNLLNINIPTCIPGFSPRGTLTTVVKPAPLTGAQYVLQDCTSIEPIGNIMNDLEAFNHGFISITDMGVNVPPNWP